VRTFKQL